MNELNLLLRQQIIKQSSGNLDVNYSIHTPQETFYEEGYSGNLVVPRKATFKDCELGEYSEELKIELANIQLEESTALEQHKTLSESFSLLEIIKEHILNHIDCIVLEVKSASRLSSWLNSYAVHEQCITNQISTSLKKLNDSYDLSTLETIKSKLLMDLNENNSIKKLFNEFQDRQSNYKLALKNFKIILEILNVNEDSLKKLKQQFDEVLMDYQHCRCILDHELPFVIAEGTKTLVNCLNLLGNEFDLLTDKRDALSSVLKDLGQKVQDNEYVLVKKEIVSSQSSDTA